VRVYGPNGSWAGDAVVKSVLRNPGVRLPAPVPDELRVLHNCAADKTLYFQDLKLDHELPAEFAWIAVDANQTGNGFVIRNCKVFHNRERGMLLKASNGLVEDNVIDGSTVGGIVFFPEVASWDEVDYTHHTTIRHNLIRDVGFWRNPLGPLNISETRDGIYVPWPGGHRDVVVEDNTFEQNDGVNVIVTSAQAVKFRNNHFIAPMQHLAVGVDSRLDAFSLFWVDQSRNVSLENNDVIQPGQFMRTVLTATKTTQNVMQTGGSAPNLPH